MVGSEFGLHGDDYAAAFKVQQRQRKLALNAVRVRDRGPQALLQRTVVGKTGQRVRVASMTSRSRVSAVSSATVTSCANSHSSGSESRAGVCGRVVATDTQPHSFPPV